LHQKISVQLKGAVRIEEEICLLRSRVKQLLWRRIGIAPERPRKTANENGRHWEQSFHGTQIIARELRDEWCCFSRFQDDCLDICGLEDPPFVPAPPANRARSSSMAIDNY
jgi:hypothetical protein